ncbi:unnamed protein product, partial [Chrysoparadoxa australica]
LILLSRISSFPYTPWQVFEVDPLPNELRGAPLGPCQADRWTFSPSTWVDTDGLVYSPLFCHACKPPQLCGVKIIAAAPAAKECNGRVWLCKCLVKELVRASPAMKAPHPRRLTPEVYDNCRRCRLMRRNQIEGRSA